MTQPILQPSQPLQVSDANSNDTLLNSCYNHLEAKYNELVKTGAKTGVNSLIMTGTGVETKEDKHREFSGVCEIALSCSDDCIAFSYFSLRPNEPNCDYAVVEKVFVWDLERVTIEKSDKIIDTIQNVIDSL